MSEAAALATSPTFLAVAFSIVPAKVRVVAKMPQGDDRTGTGNRLHFGDPVFPGIICRLTGSVRGSARFGEEIGRTHRVGQRERSASNDLELCYRSRNFPNG